MNYTLSENNLSGIYINDTNHLITNPATTQISTHNITVTATDTVGQSVSTTASFVIKGSEPIIDPDTPIFSKPNPIHITISYDPSKIG